ncbi:hypothetical protein GEMRC1_001150 [Eukaryota sp. GEM-RC1]
MSSHTPNRKPTPPPPVSQNNFSDSLMDSIQKLSLTSDPKLPPEQSEGTLEWGRDRSHLIIMNDSGLPVYTLHGDEHSLNSFCGVLSATIGLISSIGDGLATTPARLSAYNPKLIQAGKTNMVFFYEHSLVFAIVSDSLPPPILFTQLGFVHGLITSLLTGVRVSVEKKKLAHYLSGSKTLFDNLLSLLNQSLFPYFSTIPSPILSLDLRRSLQKSILPPNDPAIVFTILCTQDHVIGMGFPKNLQSIHTSDLVLLLNLIQTQTSMHNSNSRNLVPFCFSFTSSISNSWIYLMIEKVYDSPTMFLITGTRKASNVEALTKYSENLKNSLSPFLPKLTNAFNTFSISNLGILRLRHFICYIVPPKKFVSSSFEFPLNCTNLKKELNQLYFQIHSDLFFNAEMDSDQDSITMKSPKVSVREVSQLGKIVGFQTPDYVLYCLFDSFVSGETIIDSCNLLIQQLRGAVDSEDGIIQNIW